MNKLIRASFIGIVASGFITAGLVATAANAAPGDQAVVRVSKSTGLNSEGETITITGSGFVPNGLLTNGARPPLAGTFSGVYVSFGKFQDVWRPSESAPSGNRKSSQSDITRTNWLVLAANLASIGGAAGGGVELAADGTFSITLKVSKTLVSSSNTTIFDESTIGNYGIYTYAASGANYAPFETYTPLTFAPTIVTAPVETLKMKISNQIEFAGGSNSVTKSAKRELNKEISNYKIASKVVITSTAGATAGASDMVVKSLAKKRANAIKKYLVKQGVSADKIVIKAKAAKSGKKPSTQIVATP